MLDLRILMSLAVTAMFVNSAVGVKHVVGGPDGSWDQMTDLAKWASGLTFKVGDTLDFTYGLSHSVVEVKTQKAYDDCDMSSPVSTDSDGETKITLSSAGKRFFVCGDLDHCVGGMKVTIVTVSSSTPTAKSPPKSNSTDASPPISQGTLSEPPHADSPKPNAGNGGYEANLAMVLGFGLMTLMCL